MGMVDLPGNKVSKGEVRDSVILRQPANQFHLSAGAANIFFDQPKHGRKIFPFFSGREFGLPVTVSKAIFPLLKRSSS
jgi:hypothetical protein